MTTPTVPVTCLASDQSGAPIAGAVFRARLTRTDLAVGYVAPEQVEAIAGADGVAVLNLWPNVLGSVGSQYRVAGFNPDTQAVFLDALITVPNNPCELHELARQELPSTPATHKQGDTFDYADRLIMLVDGVPVTDFSGMTGASQIRTPAGELVADLVFTWLDAVQGFYRARHNGSTAAWPVGELLHDVQLTTANGDVVSTATEKFTLEKDVTHG